MLFSSNAILKGSGSFGGGPRSADLTTRKLAGMEIEKFVLIIVLLAEVLAVMFTVRRFRFLPSPSLILIWIVLGQVVLWLARERVINYSFLLTYARGGVFNHFYAAEYFYSLLFFFFFVCHFGLGRNIERDGRGRLMISRKALMIINLLSLCIVVFCLGSLSLLIDWSIAWQNSQYLSMTNRDIIISNPLWRGLIGVLMPVGIISATLSATNLVQRSFFWSIIFAMAAACPVFYFLASHSRVAAVPLVVFVIVINLASTGSRKILSVVLSLIAFATIISAITGREAGVHGISTIPNILSNIAGSRSSIVDTIVPNVFEGAFVLAEGLTLNPEYPTIFKVLSLAPTPSIIDGFDQIRDIYQVRLSKYAPLSGYAEAYLFGIPYMIFAGIIVFISVRLTFKIVNTNRTLFLLCNTFLFIGFYITNAYPLRNGLKSFWMADAIVIGFILWRSVSIQQTFSKLSKGNRQRRDSSIAGRQHERD